MSDVMVQPDLPPELLAIRIDAEPDIYWPIAIAEIKKAGQKIRGHDEKCWRRAALLLELERYAETCYLLAQGKTIEVEPEPEVELVKDTLDYFLSDEFLKNKSMLEQERDDG